MRRSVQANSDVRHRAVPAPGRGWRKSSNSKALAENEPGSAGLPVPRRFTSLTRKAEEVALSQSLGDYATSPDDALTPEIESLVSLGGACHYRMHLRKPYGVGHAEFCGIADGFFVHIADLVMDEPYPLSVSAPDMLRVRVASDGEGEYVTAHGEILDIRGPGAAIIIEPAGVPPAEAVYGSGPNRCTMVYIHADALRLLFADSEQELPAVLQAFLAGNLQRTVVRRLPLGPGLLRCLDDLQSSALEGRARRLLIQSKAVEILCHAFEALVQEDDLGSVETSAAATRGVLRAQRLLLENFVTPPSLEDLAQEVGMSRSGLCTAFRQILGQTVFDYINDLRMQRALALLNQRDSSITQIAYAVGYNHPSSFSVAVQRRFGTTPSELRRRGLPSV